MGQRNRELKWTRKKSHTDSAETQTALEPLIEKAKRGDDDALYSLCESIAGKVLTITKCLTGNTVDADDISQEVLIYICEKIGSLRNPKKFNGWLYKIIETEVKLHFRKNAKQRVVLDINNFLESIEESKAEFLPQEFTESAEVKQAVLESIDRLPPRQREAVILHYYCGQTVNQVAEAMDIDHSSVSKHLSSAREKMRVELQKQIGKSKIPALSAFISAQVIDEILSGEFTEITAVDEASKQKLLLRCRESIKQRKLVVPSGDRRIHMMFFPIMGLLSLLVVGLGFTLAVTLFEAPVITQPSITGEIVFSGGVYRGNEIAYLNPTDVHSITEGADGAVDVLEWYITPEYSLTKLYSGNMDSVSDALLELRSNEGDGIYIIHFRVKSKSGTIIDIYENFIIDYD